MSLDDRKILEMSGKFIASHILQSVYLFGAIVEYLKNHLELVAVFIVKALIYAIIRNKNAFDINQ